jgi:deazaflavin-dependent oxidoreductase (nitroreductase family)
MANSPDEAYVNNLIADSRRMDELNQSVIKEFRANQGRVGGAMEAMPILLLTMIGAKTRRTLTRPLCYSREGDRLVVIASYGGAPRNPPWYHNLVANPLVTVEVGTEKFKARAAKTSGAERQRLFDAQAQLIPFFDDYQKKAKRQIPVLTLTRID